jgi:glutathione S-transferase
MQLYFSPFACSMATRIALYEAGAKATYINVDPKTKQTADGGDFLAINPLGLVPVLRTDDGDMLTENAAILQYVADRDGIARARLHQWLSFVGTELHKALFIPLFDSKLPSDVRAAVLETGRTRLDYLAKHLEGRDYLLDRYSVADAYLFTVLNWTRVTGIDLAQWPAIKNYVRRLNKRPSIAAAMAEEGARYAEEQLGQCPAVPDPPASPDAAASESAGPGRPTRTRPGPTRRAAFRRRAGWSASA